MKRSVFCSLAVMCQVLLSVCVYAASSEGQDGGQGRRKGPPPEAFELCEGKSVGDSVEITSPQGDKVEGVCKEMNGKMVAVPANMPERGGQKRQ